MMGLEALYPGSRKSGETSQMNDQYGGEDELNTECSITMAS